MPEVKPCPMCHRKPEHCTCPPGERWLALDGLWLRLTDAGVVDVRVHATTTDTNLREASPTIRAWAKRLYREDCPVFGDVLSEFDARQRAGESWKDLALAIDRRLREYTRRLMTGEFDRESARTIAVHELRQVGVGEQTAMESVDGLIDAVERGKNPFDDRYPVVDRETIQQAVSRWRKQHST